MYTNTEQITPKNDPKGWTQHLGELSVSPLAEVLQVCVMKTGKKRNLEKLKRKKMNWNLGKIKTDFIGPIYI